MQVKLNDTYSLVFEKFQIVLQKNDKNFLYYNTLPSVIKKLVQLNLVDNEQAIYLHQLDKAMNFKIKTLELTLRKELNLPMTYTELGGINKLKEKKVVIRRTVTRRENKKTIVRRR